jgi:hypothetical protein
LSNKRVKIISIIGAKSFSSEIKSHIGLTLRKKWGGCFISTGDGFWSSKGNDFQDEYPSTSVKHEESLKIELTVVLGAEENAVISIREIMDEIKDKDSIFIRFVHVEKIPCEVAHQDLRLRVWDANEVFDHV